MAAKDQKVMKLQQELALLRSAHPDQLDGKSAVPALTESGGLTHSAGSLSAQIANGTFEEQHGTQVAHAVSPQASHTDTPGCLKPQIRYERWHEHGRLMHIPLHVGCSRESTVCASFSV